MAPNLRSSAATHNISKDSVAIAGGGIIGLSIAWRLAQAGFAVSVYDKGKLGSEATWAAAGMLSLGGEIETDSAESRLAIESRRLYSGFVQELRDVTGYKIDYQECGSLDVAYSSSAKVNLESRAVKQADLGIVSSALSPEEVADGWPRVRREALAAARFYPEDAIVNPRDVVAALAIACHKLGVGIYEDCAVARIRVLEGGAAVRTASGEEQFGAAVLAAGAWSDQIRVEGVPCPPAAEPIKGHLIGYMQPEQTCRTIVRHGHTYLLQRANGLMIAGASVEHVGFDREIKAAVAEEIAAQAAFIFPHLGQTTTSEVWVGFRPGSQGLQMGSWHSPNLHLAYGHFRNGILLAPVTAQRVAAELTASLQTR